MQDIIAKLLIPFIIQFVTRLLTEENMKKWGDRLFDLIEDAINDSETALDDNLLPLIAHMRKVLDIPDNDV